MLFENLRAETTKLHLNHCITTVMNALKVGDFLKDDRLKKKPIYSLKSGIEAHFQGCF